MDYISMIDEYQFTNEIDMIENVINSIGISEDVLNEAEASSIKMRVNKIWESAKEAFKRLKESIFSFFKKFFSKSNAQEKILDAEEEMDSEVPPEDVDNETFEENMNKVNNAYQQSKSNNAYQQSKSNNAYQQSKSNNTSNNTLGIGTNPDNEKLKQKPINMGTSKSGPTIYGYDYKDIHVKVYVADREKVSKVLEISRSSVTEIDKIDEMLNKMKSNFNFKSARRYSRDASEMFINYGLDGYNSDDNMSDIKSIVGESIMKTETLTKSKLPDFISKEHKYINKIEKESNKITDIIEKRLPKTESLLRSLDIDKILMEYYNGEENGPELSSYKANHLLCFNIDCSHVIKTYQKMFKYVSELLKEIIKTKSTLIAYGKAYRAARRKK